ncbi:TraB/GumN family protein [Myroides marinus]|uniref:TraB/GumN family protein n=1 Tax=Myroides marinus TaxID=703342 RepID=UPI002574B019|nr:TraB/GumN family protein [Myroides marinus]MDM1345742.1 TraB/GumN family protein [Myroides marinus]MDM1349397.1 TraB/GumN family protein [Myroides marinus]MDM1352925.1 TraB/GumN family protein [Myroides marinus]MDM1356607.1 TraB/GumN family protein [Myroides marinus]MDM1360967.1 TraB/GumN family protein [Myroides marinus]
MRKHILVSILFFTSIVSIFGQEVLDKSLLWEITGNGLHKPSYIVGTIHIMCKDDFVLTPKVQRVIDRVDNLTLEVNFTDPKEIVEIQKSMNNQVSLTRNLDEDNRKELVELLINEYGLSNSEVDSISSLGLMNLMTNKELQCEVVSYDVELIMLGMKKGKNFGGLEHGKEQLELFNKAFSVKEIVRQLKLKDESTDNLTSIIEAFKNEDMNKLYELGTDTQFMPMEVRSIMLDNRNKMWVEKMGRIMLIESTLFAVGSAHLGGEVGVIELLRKKGYDVTPVYE